MFITKLSAKFQDDMFQPMRKLYISYTCIESFLKHAGVGLNSCQNPYVVPLLRTALRVL